MRFTKSKLVLLLVGADTVPRLRSAAGDGDSDGHLELHSHKTSLPTRRDGRKVARSRGDEKDKERRIARHTGAAVVVVSRGEEQLDERERAKEREKDDGYRVTRKM